jgi:phospholipase C
MYIPVARIPYRLALVAFLGLSSAALAVVPRSNHVVLVVEENHSYESVIGNPAMPFFNQLASSYGLATSYYANGHHSIPNYFWLTAGQPVTFNDSTRSSFNADNIVRHMLTAAKTWKSYAESLPFSGYTGFNVYPYVKRHNPLAYFTDVANSDVQKLNLVSFTQFAVDLRNGQLPNFSFVSPNLLHDAHDGLPAAADQWLRQNIGPLLASPAFRPGGDGILIITFDESFDTDCRPLTCGTAAKAGGRVATIVVGPGVKRQFKSGAFYQHQNLLKTVGVALGISVPGAASRARPMAEFFK